MWTPTSSTAHFASPTSFFVDGNQTTTFPAFTRLRFTQHNPQFPTNIDTKYATVESASYSSGRTMVNLVESSSEEVQNSPILSLSVSPAAFEQGHPGSMPFTTPRTTALAQPYVYRQSWAEPLAADADLLIDGEATVDDDDTVIEEFLAQPDFPRNITLTTGGTTTDVAAGNVVVEGTNIRDEVISETLAVTENQNGATTGNKAFKTVTKITIPAQDGAGATYDFGIGVKLGLERLMTEASVIDAFVDGVRETTAATVAFSDTAIENNTLITSTAPNGTRDFKVLLVTSEIR